MSKKKKRGGPAPELPFFWLPFAPIVVAVLAIIVMLLVACGSEEPTGIELAGSVPAPRCTVIRFLFPPSYERVLEVRLCASWS